MTDREMLEMLVEGQRQMLGRLDKIDEELASIKNRQDTLEGRQRLLEKKFDRLVEVDIKHLKYTQDTIVTLLQAKGIIPTGPKSIRA